MACAPEYVPLSRELDPCFALQHDSYELVRQMSRPGGTHSVEDEDVDRSLFLTFNLTLVK